MGLLALRRDSENTPLQLKLNGLAEVIAKIGRIAGVLLFVVLFIRFSSFKSPQTTPQGDPLSQFIFQRPTDLNNSKEPMANTSVICTEKTGTFTQNEMTVVAGSVGVHAKLVPTPEAG